MSYDPYTNTIETNLDTFTLRNYFNAGEDEGLEATNDAGDLVTLPGESIPDPDDSHDVNRIINLIDEAYLNL